MKTVAFLLFLIPGALHVSVGAQTMRFSDILARLYNTGEWKAAELLVQISEQEYLAALQKNDWNLNLSPQYRRTQNMDTGTAGSTVSATMGLNIYTGLTAVQEERKNSLFRDRVTAQIEAATARKELVLTMHGLYTEVWLRQEEEALLEAENRLYEDSYAAKLQLYEGGAATLDAVEQAEEDLRKIENARMENSLKLRIAWFALKSSGIIDTDQMVPFEPYWLSLDAVPRPADIEQQALENSSSYSRLSGSLQTLRDTRTRLSVRDWDLTLKNGFSYEDHSALINYGLDSRMLELNYDLPAWIDPAPSQAENWTLTLGFTFRLPGNNQTDATVRILEKESALIQEQRTQVQAQVSLLLRTVYQQWLMAQEGYATALRAAERAQRLKASVETRRSAGQALELDVRKAQIGSQRAEFSLLQAKRVRQTAYARYFSLIGKDVFLP